MKLYSRMKLNTLDEKDAMSITEDPVRPELDYKFRIKNGRQIYALKTGDDFDAVLCVGYTDQIPSTVEELDLYAWPEFNDQPSIAVFYTVWSYTKGAGRKIIFDVVDHIKEVKTNTRLRYVTLSPKTRMAYRFHTRNGALLLRENELTDNYEYINV